MKIILVLVLSLIWGIVAFLKGSDIFIVVLLAMIYYQLALKE